MADSDLFSEENAMVKKIAHAIVDHSLTVHDARLQLSALLSNYEKLLRQTKQLIKLSDSKARQLQQVNLKLKVLSDEFEFQSKHDALTGLINKGQITYLLQSHLATCDFVLLLFDLDFFKKINDEYGHIVGDHVLRGVADLVKSHMTESDYAGRFGGDEFLIIFNHVGIDEASNKAEALRTLIAVSALELDGVTIHVTVSMGLTLCRKMEQFTDVYVRADQSLYLAKSLGRNRVTVANPYCAN